MQYLKKEGRDEVDFLLVDKHQTFLKAGFISFDGHNHAQSNQNKKYAISWQYFKKEASDIFHLLHEDTHQSLLQADTIPFGGHSQTSPKYQK